MPARGAEPVPRDALPVEAREKIFAAMLEELIRENGGGHGLIMLDTSDGRSFGYLCPPEAAKKRHERMMSELPEDVRAELTKPLPADFDFNDTFDFEELFSEPQRADAA